MDDLGIDLSLEATDLAQGPHTWRLKAQSYACLLRSKSHYVKWSFLQKDVDRIVASGCNHNSWLGQNKPQLKSCACLRGVIKVS